MILVYTVRLCKTRKITSQINGNLWEKNKQKSKLFWLIWRWYYSEKGSDVYWNKQPI